MVQGRHPQDRFPRGFEIGLRLRLAEMDVTLTAFIEQVANGTMMGAIYVLVALGLVLIFGVMEVLNFAHGVIFMAGGYVCDVFFVHAIDNYPAAVILTVITLAIV